MFHGLEETTFRVMAYGISSGSLSIGVFSTFATKWLIPRLPRFKADHPDVLINCFVRPAPFDFDADTLDAAIHYGRPVWPGALVEPLFGEVLVPVASPLLPGIAAVRSAADLARLPLLHEVTRPAAWHDWFNANGVDNIQAFLGARFDQFGMVAQAAIAQCGVALIPRFLIEAELESGVLVMPINLPVSGTHQYCLVSPHRNKGLRPLQDFRDWLIAESASLAAR
jgi:LysR family glycine cleavage system transcriptional activator